MSVVCNKRGTVGTDIPRSKGPWKKSRSKVDDFASVSPTRTGSSLGVDEMYGVPRNKPVAVFFPVGCVPSFAWKAGGRSTVVAAVSSLTVKTEERGLGGG